MAKQLEVIDLTTKQGYLEIVVWDDGELVLELEDTNDYANGILSKEESKKLYEALKKHYDR